MSHQHEISRDDLIRELGSDGERGLSAGAVLEARSRYGRNEFDEQETEGIVKKILHNLRDVSTIILLVAALISLIMALSHDEGFVEFFVIIGIVILNMFLAISQERSAEKSLNALKQLNSPTSMVFRDAAPQEIDTAEIVPGDIILLKTGDLVPADARLLESADLAVDESALTGESEPSEKEAEMELRGKMAVADQCNMVFSGTLVTAGYARAIVTAIGMGTQVGAIALHLNDTQKLRTPLQVRLDKIGKAISVVAVVSALLMFFIGLSRGTDIWEMAFVAVSLAVAAVPETLSLIVTLTLSHGVAKMAEKNALIRKLPAVETLGSASVICTDKTGTLTQNLMTITRIWRAGEVPCSAEDMTERELDTLSRFALASNALVRVVEGEERIIGDPTESAILRLTSKQGCYKEELERRYPRVAEISFSSARKMMTTVHEHPAGGFLVLTKGAIDRVPFAAAAGAEEERQRVHDSFAEEALRVIALGSKRVDELPPADRLGELERDLEFEGIIGIIDPPRPECAEAIRRACNAGVRTVMITGDHAATATAIGKQIGLIGRLGGTLTGLELSEMSDEELVRCVPQYSVYARVSPDDKIRIVQAWQEHDEVVAMTGDGVNDAPALKAADVGVAMGITGTDVAKGASDMILMDDNFSTIVEAIGRGRNVFSNIRKTVYFLLVCNFSEIIIMLGAQLIGWGVPLTPIMLLLINVIGDGIPGIQLAYETSDPRLMTRHPIGRHESLFDGLQFVIAQQTMACVVVGWLAYYIGAFVIIPGAAPSLVLGQTLTFLVVGWSSILHAFTVRSRQSVFKRTLRDNPRIVTSAVAMVALFALFVLVPPVTAALGMTAVGPLHWALAVLLAVAPSGVAEIGKWHDRIKEAREHGSRLLKHNICDDF